MLETETARSIPGVLFVEDFDDLSPFQSAGSRVIAQMSRVESGAVAIGVTELDESSLEHGRLLTEARDEGFAAGYAAAEAGILAAREMLLRRIENALEEAERSFLRSVEADLGRVAEVALSVLLASFPALCARHGNAELARMLREMLPTLIDEPVVKLFVHPLDEQLAREEIGTLVAAGSRVSVVVAGDVLRGDIRLAWENGVAARDSERARDAMLAGLQAQGLVNADDREAAR